VTHYEVLGVAATASVDEIKRAFRDQARRHHPDIGGGGDAMERLNRAWATLGDPVRRRAYDNVLGIGVAMAPPPAPPPFVPVDEEEGDDEADWGPDPIPEPSRPRDTLVLVPVILLAMSVGSFALATMMLAPVLQGLAIAFLALAGLTFALVPIITLRRQARRTYR
jgi:hypothetical protein